jgi:transcriptional regulator GlxA family with amidase domain
MYQPQKSLPKGQPHRLNMTLAVSARVAMRFTICPKPDEPAAGPGTVSEASGFRQSPAARRLAVCVDYMRQNLNRPLKISDLSALVGLSESRFYSLFRRDNRDTPLNWFIQLRIRRAAELVEATDSPVNQIASQVGYNDPLSFSRRFKSVHGARSTRFPAKRRP